MRETNKTPLLTVLALAFVALLVTPIATAAASGLPAAVSMNPATATPGATVEVNGLDFPPLTVVDIHVATNEGVVPLVSTVSSDTGYFREVVVLPATLPASAWQLRAAAIDGTLADFALDAGGSATASDTSAATAAAATPAGSSGSDILVMLVLAALMGTVIGGGMIAWRLVHDTERQPGMARGDDPIWSVSGGESMLELAGMEEPTWSAAPGKS